MWYFLDFNHILKSIRIDSSVRIGNICNSMDFEWIIGTHMVCERKLHSKQLAHIFLILLVRIVSKTFLIMKIVHHFTQM